MTAPQAERRTGRTVGAFVAGLVVGLVPTLGTDAILHVTKAFSPYRQTATDRARSDCLAGFDRFGLVAHAA